MAKPEPISASSPSTCYLCHQEFETEFSHEADLWICRSAVRYNMDNNKIIAHKTCL
jgi:hypothetical protein